MTGLRPELRLPDAVRPGQVRLQVADLGRSLEFYRKLLGFEAVATSGGRASLSISGGGPPIIELVERRGVAPVPRRGRLGLYHYAILLPDRPALGRFALHLAEKGTRVGASDHGVSEALYLQDPDGLGIEVYADRPQESWQRDDEGQIVMVTEPLDVPDLIASAHEAGHGPGDAGRESGWVGMPPGSMIGHVHLHVGDLARAAGFYEETLGLDRTVWSYPGALFLSAGGYHHHLGLNTWAAGAAAAGENDARLLEWELLVPTDRDARDTLDRLSAAGHAVEPDSEGGRTLDPWGTGLRIRSTGRG